jgi:ferredoxin
MGKVLGSILGFIEVPILEGVKKIDNILFKGFYEIFMRYFSLFYGSRVIPLSISIDSTLSISPTEEVLEIIQRMPSVSIGYCYCRTTRRKSNPETISCTHDLWTCIHIGAAKKLDELQKKIPLKTLNYEEIKEVLLAADKAGLIHQLITTPTSEYFYVICNCCTCCCVMLKDAIRHRSNNIAIASNFIAFTDEEDCNHCGNCVERCHFKARNILNEKMHFNPLIELKAHYMTSRIAPKTIRNIPGNLSLISSFKIILARNAVTKTDKRDAGSATVTSKPEIAINNIT